MATEDQLLQAFKAAADSGDEPAARAFAAELQKLRAPAPEATPAQNSAQPVGAKPSVYDAFKGDPKAERLDEAVGEAGIRTFEGLGQFATSIYQGAGDLYDKVRRPNVSELVSGKQPTLTQLKEYNQAVESRRAAVRQEYEQETGQPYPETLTKVSEILLGFAGTGGLAGAAKTGFKEAVKYGVKVGAVLAPTSYREQADVNDKIQQSLLGAAFGGGIGAGVGGVSYLKSTLAKYFQRSPNPEQLAASKLVEDPNGMFGLDLSIGQRTGNITQRQLESKVGGRELQELLLNQAKDLRTKLEAAARNYGPDLSPREIANKGGLALEGQIKKLRSVRKDIFESDLGLIRTKLAADAGVPAEQGGKVLVKIPSFGNKLSQVLDEKGVDISSLSPAIRGYIEKYQQSGGALSFDDLSKLLVKLNERNYTIASASGNPQQVADLAGGIRKAVNSSLDDIAESSEVGKLLQQARTSYGEQSKRIADIKESSLAAALGIDAKSGMASTVQNPEQALNKILSLSPTEQKEVGSLLKVGSQTTLKALRNYNLRQALTEATDTVSPGMPDINVEKLVKLTTGNGKLRAAGLYSEKDAENLRKNLDALRVLLSKADFKANVAEPEGIAMSAVGLLKGAASAPFAARILSRLTGAGGLEKVLFNPQAQKDFLTISNAFGGKSVAATRAASQASARIEALLDSEDSDEDQ